MFKKARNIALVAGALAAVSFGGSALATAGAAPVQPTQKVVSTQKAADKETADGATAAAQEAGDTETADGAQQGADSETNDGAQEGADTETNDSSSEVPGNDGPGGHADEPGNPNTQNQE
jgi:hypothetical protein